jgi:hypothetical protein
MAGSRIVANPAGPVRSTRSTHTCSFCRSRKKNAQLRGTSPPTLRCAVDPLRLHHGPQVRLRTQRLNTAQKTELLNCAPEALDHIIILRSRDDYARMTATTAPSRRSPSPSQHALL